MKSERLRPMSRHSERKEKKKLMTSRKVGEHVLAKWSDCKMYPAKILANKLPAGYEVLFYDGFKKLVQPPNIQALPPDHKKMDPIPTNPTVSEGNNDNSVEEESSSLSTSPTSAVSTMTIMSATATTPTTTLTATTVTTTSTNTTTTTIMTTDAPPSPMEVDSKEEDPIPEQESPTDATEIPPETELKLPSNVRERRSSSVSSTASSGTLSIESIETLKEFPPTQTNTSIIPKEFKGGKERKDFSKASGHKEECSTKPVARSQGCSSEKKKETFPAAEGSKKEGKKKEKPNMPPNKRRQRLIVAGAFLAKRDTNKKSPPLPSSKQSMAKFKAPTGKSKHSSECEKEEKSVEKKTGSDRKSLSPSSSSSTPPSTTSTSRNSAKDHLLAMSKVRFDTDRPVSEMKELEKALTIGFLPNTQPGMAPLSSTVTPSLDTFRELTASTSSLLNTPITTATVTKPMGEKVRLKPGRGRKKSVSSKKGVKKRSHTDYQNGICSDGYPLKREPTLASPLSPAASKDHIPKKRGRFSEKEKKEKIASKEFVIQVDHNPYKCVFDNCRKSFRKEHRLEYHVKYYHIEDGKAVTSPNLPPPKRRKTSSICSTDSEHSQKAKSEASSKRRHSQFHGYPSLDSTSTLDSPGHFSHEDSCSADVMEEESETPLINKRQNRRSKNNSFSASERSILADSLVDESLEMEEEDTSSEVIHCVCNLVEEKGLMIQCEVCMCWQHATCMNLDEATLPKKYICSVCRNPKGLRPSAQYIYDQDWIKLGQLPRFSFVEADENEDEIVQKILATNNLVGDMHNIKAVLHGLQQQIKINLNKDQDGLKLWTKNWCNLSETIFSPKPEVKEELHSTFLAGLDDERCFVDPVTVDPQVPDEILADQQADDPVPDAEEESVQQPPSNGMSSDTPSANNNGTQTTDNMAQAANSLTPNQNNSGGRRAKTNGLPKENEVSPPTNTSGSTPAMANGNNEQSPLPSDEQPTHPPSSRQNPSVDGEGADSNDANQLQNNENVDGSIKKPAMLLTGDSATDKLMDSSQSGRENDVKSEDGDDAKPECDVKVEEVDPLQQNQMYMLQCVMQTQHEIDSRLNKIVEQIDILEEQEKLSSPISVGLPLLKKSLRNMMHDLGKVRRMATYH